MKFSAQEEYGLRCLLQIACASSGSRTIPEISDSEGLGQAHVAKLLMILRRAEFINSTRGQSGGYTLARPATEIKVSDVLGALGGRLFDEEFCSKHSTSPDLCTRTEDCAVRGLWQMIQTSVDTALQSVSLADLMPSTGTRVELQNRPPDDLREKVGASS